jgi:DNA-binding Xre family transcriptional regulator
MLTLMPKELKFQCNLKKIMEDRELNATELHRKTGIALTTIRSMTNGGTLDRIDRGSTEKILKNLGCDFSELWAIEWDGIDD